MFLIYILVLIKKLDTSFHRNQITDSPTPSCGKKVVLSKVLLFTVTVDITLPMRTAIGIGQQDFKNHLD